MSRIYQGGSSQRSFKSNQGSQGFRPNTVQSNAKEIQQRGQAAIRDLQTLDRERQRQEKMSSLEQDVADRAARLDLEVEQKAAAAQLRLYQLKDRADVGMSQLEERNTLKLKQAFDKASFDLGQTVARTNLKTKQGLQSGKFALEQNAARQEIARDQMLEKQTLQSEQSYENFILGIESRGQSAQFAVDRAELQAQQTVQRANNQLLSTAVNSLLSFGMAVGNQVMAEKAEEEQKAQQRAELGMDFLYSPQGSAVSVDGTPNPVAKQQTDLQESEQAVEASIAQVSGGNPIEAENIRQPLADATMDRDLRQASIGEAAIMFPAEYEAFIQNPETKSLVNGQMISLGEVRSRPELREWLHGAATQLTTEFGIDGKDAHALVMQYSRSAKGAIAAAEQNLSSTLIASLKDERFEAAVSNAANLSATGNHQEAWKVVRNGYITSGLAFGKTAKQINDAAFDRLVKATPNLDALANVQKIPGQAGTEFGKPGTEYAKMIQTEKLSRLKAQNQSDAINSTYNNNRVKEVMYETQSLLLNAKNGEESKAIRQNAVAQLQALGTPDARDEIAKLSKNQSYNQQVFLGLMERASSGVPPSSSEVAEAVQNGEISHAQMEAIKKTGDLGDVIDRRIKETGLPDGEKYMGSEIRAMLMNGRIGGAKLDGESARGLTQSAVASYAPEFDARLKEFVVSKPEATRQEIIQEAQNIRNTLLAELHTPATSGSKATGTLSYNPETRTVDFKPPHFGEGRVVARVNPITGETQRDYSNVKSNAIPQGASQRDVYLNTDEYLQAREAWQEGEVKFTPRINNIARKLGLSPRQLVEQQTLALGYPPAFRVSDTPSSASSIGDYQQIVTGPVKDALNVLGRYESDSSGSYNAVNQGGLNDGRTTVGYSGDFRQMPQHGGKDLTSMTIAEIQALQAETGQSQDSWNAEGRLHAVGRYQFIGPTLSWAVGQTGIDPNTQFTPAVQDYLAGWLLQQKGITQWVGPNDYASQAERGTIASARAKLANAWQVLSNPNAGQIQLERARRTVGYPF